HEETMAGFGGFTRLVRRNPDAVPHVLISGRIAAERGQLRDPGHGRFLGAGGVKKPPPPSGEVSQSDGGGSRLRHPFSKVSTQCGPTGPRDFINSNKRAYRYRPGSTPARHR